MSLFCKANRSLFGPELSPKNTHTLGYATYHSNYNRDKNCSKCNREGVEHLKCSLCGMCARTLHQQSRYDPNDVACSNCYHGK